MDHLYTKGELERSALVAEICAESRQNDPTHWNNLGFFLVKRLEELEESEDPAPDPALQADLGERALVAYGRALELSPDDPRFLNDLGVVLHHHLGRELERARALYERALELARATLADPETRAGERAYYESVVVDAQANLEELAPLLEATASDAPAQE